MSVPGPLRVTLPATSANLGPGFDAVGLALSLHLQVDAAAGSRDSVHAVGRNASACARLERNLILSSYRAALAMENATGPALVLQVENEIPLGMGCGSSAAARLAGVAMASHFGGLNWKDGQIVAAATKLEGHPDNVAACWYGGFTVSVPHGSGVDAATFALDEAWQLLLALPGRGLATDKARGVLPGSYSREDAVFNLQRVALLTAAFAQQRLDLLRPAMQDRMHQPYRQEVCMLLRHLEALNQGTEFAGVALSGAGPALLAVLNERTTMQQAEQRMRSLLGDGVELLPVRIAGPARSENLGRS